MPNSQETIIGHCLLQPELLSKLKKEYGLVKDDFTSQRLRKIFKELETGNTEISIIAEKVGDSGIFTYLSGLMDGIPKSKPENVGQLVNQIKKDRFSREITKLINSAANSGEFNHPEIQRIYEKIAALEDPEKSKIQPVLTTLSDTTPEQVSWLWFNRIPLGKLTLIVGDPGHGKSYFSLYLAAHVTTEKPWPEIGMPIEKGSVILLTAEDGIADTVRIRTDIMGADVNKIYILEGIKTPDNEELTFFNLVEHISSLAKAVKEIGDVRLIIIDPITAYLENLDSNSATAIRSALAPLAKLAEREKIAVVAISHLNKDIAKRAIYRAMGSMSFIAAARSVWAISRDDNDENYRRRFLTPLKTNLSIDPSSLAFSIGNDGVVFEADPVDITSEEALGDKEEKDEYSQLQEAKEWLKVAFIESKAIPAKQILKEAKENFIKERTLKRAKSQLGISSFRMGNVWHWGEEEFNNDG